MPETSFRIMETDKFLDNPHPNIFYKADCACGRPECELVLELYYNENIEDIVLMIYSNLKYCSWWGISRYDHFYFFKDMYRRIIGALKLLFTGRIKLEETFLFENAKQIDEFINALMNGTEKIINLKKGN